MTPALKSGSYQKSLSASCGEDSLVGEDPSQVGIGKALALSRSSIARAATTSSISASDAAAMNWSARKRPRLGRSERVGVSY